jgi:hypothetical protein
VILIALAATFAVPDTPLAIGESASVEAVTRAAQRCGMQALRFDPLDPERAMLLMGRKNSPRSLECTRAWMKRNRERLRLESLYNASR